jgi:hypothetical protein
MRAEPKFFCDVVGACVARETIFALFLPHPGRARLRWTPDDALAIHGGCRLGESLMGAPRMGCRVFRHANEEWLRHPREVSEHCASGIPGRQLFSLYQPLRNRCVAVDIGDPLRISLRHQLDQLRRHVAKLSEIAAHLNIAGLVPVRPEAPARRVETELGLVAEVPLSSGEPNQWAGAIALRARTHHGLVSTLANPAADLDGDLDRPAGAVEADDGSSRQPLCHRGERLVVRLPDVALDRDDITVARDLGGYCRCGHEQQGDGDRALHGSH